MSGSLGTEERATRTWASSDERFTVTARLVGHRAGKVYLENSSGREIQVPVERLCDKDREYIQSQYPDIRNP